MAVKVKLNSAGMKALLNSAGVRAELTRRAGPVLAAAEAGAPVDEGDYKGGLHIMQDTTDRAVVRVVSGDWKGHIIEARTGNLARALDGNPAQRRVRYTTKAGKTIWATQAQVDNWTRGW